MFNARSCNRFEKEFRCEPERPDSSGAREGAAVFGLVLRRVIKPSLFTIICHGKGWVRPSTGDTRERHVAELTLNEKVRCRMSRKQAKTKATVSRPTVKPEEDPLAYEMWLTGEVEHGPVQERAAAEGLLHREFQRRGFQKRSADRRLGRKASK